MARAAVWFLVSCCVARAYDPTQVVGSVNGNFEFLGSLCFDKGTKATINIQYQTFEKYQNLVVYTQDTIDEIYSATSSGTPKDCEHQKNDAMCIDGAIDAELQGVDCTLPGKCSIKDTNSCTDEEHLIALPKTKKSDKTTTLQLTVQPKMVTEYMFIVERCRAKQLRPDLYPTVDLRFFSIASKQAVPCRILVDGTGSRVQTTEIALIVAVVFLLVIAIGLVVTTLIFWRRKHQLEQISI